MSRASKLERLNESIERWQSEQAAHTLSQLSHSTGVALRRLQQFRTDESEPNFEEALVVLGVTASREELLSYMEEFHGTSLAFVRSLESEASSRSPRLADELTRSRLSFWITAFALTGRAQQNELLRFFGTQISAEIERLQDEGLIDVSRDGVLSLKRIPNFFSSYDKRLITSMMYHFLELAQEQSPDHCRRHPYAFFGNVSEEGCVQIEDLLKEAALSISRVIHENEGNAIVAISLMDLSFKELRR